MPKAMGEDDIRSGAALRRSRKAWPNKPLRRRRSSRAQPAICRRSPTATANGAARWKPRAVLLDSGQGVRAVAPPQFCVGWNQLGGLQRGGFAAEDCARSGAHAHSLPVA